MWLNYTVPYPEPGDSAPDNTQPLGYAEPAPVGYAEPSTMDRNSPDWVCDEMPQFEKIGCSVSK